MGKALQLTGINARLTSIKGHPPALVWESGMTTHMPVTLVLVGVETGELL